MAKSNLMMLWSFLVLFHFVCADVIRDDWYNNYGGQFTVVHKGRMLRVLMYFNNVEQEECALHCVRHLRCRTFNYHYVKKACELTDEDFDEIDAEKVSSGWFNHGTPPKVDGGWSSWRNFTECTKKCNNGTLEQWRDCNSPKPEFGGIDCNGRMRRRVKCNTHECPVVNVAFGQIAKQSSVNSPDNIPSNAVDGNYYNHAHTKEEDYPWWSVDLKEIRVIKNIILYAYQYPGNYNKGLFVVTRKTKDESWIVCKDLGDIKEKINKFKCNNELINAQFLRIQSTEKCNLDIHEVEIFGH